MLSGIDPAEALAGGPRKSGADESDSTAPNAAHWLHTHTTLYSKPTPGSYDWWMQWLLAWPCVLEEEDEERCGKEPTEDEDDAPDEPHAPAPPIGDKQ